MIENLERSLVALFISFGLLMCGCGESVDPNVADVRLKMKATTSLASINSGGRVMENHINFTQALLGVTEIEFESLVNDYSNDNDHNGDNDSKDDDSSDNDFDDGDDDDSEDGDGDENEIEFKGNFVVDLIAGTSTPDFGIADLLPGEYKEIKVKLEPILDGGNSIFIEFTYTEGDESEPVTVQYSTDVEIVFEIERHSGIQLDGGTLNQILILFDLDQFLNSINIYEATADMDGIVRINSNSNADIAAAIRAKLHLLMDAGEDDNGDGEFDDED
jgi:hypothetical protein